MSFSRRLRMCISAQNRGFGRFFVDYGISVDFGRFWYSAVSDFGLQQLIDFCIKTIIIPIAEEHTISTSLP